MGSEIERRASGREVGGGGEDKLLLHHVFIRYDLGSRSGEAEDVAGEEPRIP